MQELTSYTRMASRLLASIALVLSMAFAISVMPQPAEALQVTATTARSNSDTDNSIMGGMETRITWEGQAHETEQLTSLTLTYPEGCEVTADQVRVTGLDGLTRINLGETVTTPAANEVHVEFAEPTPAGLLIRVEASKTMLPAEGGTMGVTGSATLADGSAIDIPLGPTFDVITVTLPEQLSQKLAGMGWVQKWNENKLLHMFFDPTLIVTSIPAVAQGWLKALAMVLCSFPLAIVIGLLLCFMRISRIRVLGALGALYVNIVRGTPLFLQIYIAFFGLPLLGIVIGQFPLAVIVMSFNSSAYLCEIFRAGIESIHKGQFEASRSLGMNAMQTMFFVIIPQAFRRVIPTMTSEFILLYKDTSLFAAVGMMEMVMFAKSITATTGNMTPYIVAAIFYLLVTLPLTKFIGVFEKRLADPSHGRDRKNAANGASSGDGSLDDDVAPAAIDSDHVTVNHAVVAESR